MSKHEILVIGSKDHRRANCVDWLEPFPNIEEYDSIIINLKSLTQKSYDQIQSKIGKMRDSIRTFIDTGREVFCIIDKLIFPSPPPIRPGQPCYVRISPITPFSVTPTNYDWLPASINLDTEKKGGHCISLCNSRFRDYFEFVHEWHFEISFATSTIPAVIQSFLNSLNPIAVNKSEKMVSCSLWQTGDRKKALEGEKVGMVHLLPSPKESELFQAIESLIDIIVGTEAKSIVPWRKQIDIPNERVLNEKIETKIGEIDRIREEISQLQKQIDA